MLLYCDASCLVKLYFAEEQSETVRTWIATADGVFTSEVAFVEVCGALVRRYREGSHSMEALSVSLERWETNWPKIRRMVVDPAAAADQIRRHPLRALDAIHLAAAIALHDAAPEVTMRFASFDARQCAAARAEGLAVMGDD